SVSCIYGLGAPEDYMKMMVPLSVGQEVDRDQLLRKLVDIQYERSDIELLRGKFRVRGETIELVPAYEESGLRIRLDGDRIRSLEEIDHLTGNTERDLPATTVFPAKHFVMPPEKIARACDAIRAELDARLGELRKAGKLVEAQRLEARTNYDLELMLEVGYCKGIENYSRHLSGRKPGERPFCLIDYFPKGFLTIIDESHQTVPQINGMYNGDRARKETLVEYGFRLPSALDNRPMKFEEWLGTVGQTIFVSATPGAWEVRESGGKVAEQVIRPTGLVDPQIEVRPAKGQVADLLGEIRTRAQKNERVLVTTLTKRLAEDLTTYLTDEGIKGRYLHSEVHT
ncbi:MAG: excinuclease ABC subunit B, partial [Planctomycetota bacterium]